MAEPQQLRLGTRASALARWQANWVADRLRQLGIQVELRPITTAGDSRQTGPIGAIGTQGVFTKEIQRALLEDRIDLAVHSLKDLPTEEVEGLVLAAVPTREAEGDALITTKADRLETLPAGATVGTGSLRRQSQLLFARTDLRVADIRGNVETRLAKLDEGQFDAIVLAEAGLKRLDLAVRITQILPKAVMLPAVGQGALGIEARGDDRQTLKRLAPLDDADTHQAVLAERAMLRTLRGGCLAPVGAWGRIDQGILSLSAVVLSRDGSEKIVAETSGSPEDAQALGEQTARQLLDQGAAELIRASREEV